MASPVADRKAGNDGELPRPEKDAKQQASPKRKTSEANNPDADTNGNGNGKKKRRKVNHACVYCRRSHMTCDLERPCARCIKRDIGHLCHDEPRDPPKRSKSEVGVAEIAPAPEEDKTQRNGSLPFNGSLNGDFPPPNPRQQSVSNVRPQLAQPQALSPAQLQQASHLNAASNNTMLQGFDWNNSGVTNQFHDMHHLHPNYMFNTSEVTNEYNLLNDFLSSSLIDDGALYGNTDDTQALFNDPLLAASTLPALATNINPQQTTTSSSTLGPPPPNPAGNEISRPPSSLLPVNEARARDKFYMTAADPAGLSSAEDRLHKLLKAKYDAGMLKPFNYVKGYARLNAYMSRHLSRDSQLRILRQLERFRPKFREAMQSLTDMQLVLVEMWFERSLMEYDRVFASMAIPACCWRRTGEIFRANRAMAELVDVPMEKLRDGRLAIHQIIAEDSLVSYWEKFGAIAFDQSQKAILTSCALKRVDVDDVGETGAQEMDKVKKGREKNVVGGDGEKGSAGKGAGAVVKCCFSFTIRRDTHNIPALIVGNFLPIKTRD